jgi:uncharacterized protein YycO
MGGSIRKRLSDVRQRLRRRRWSRRRYYNLNVDALRPGDVIFSTERAAESFAIRTATGSPYSHAAIYLGHAQYAEAVGLGVRVRAVSTIVKERVKVIRLKRNAVPDAQTVAARAADKVNIYLHSPYWTKGAILSIFRDAQVEERRSLFCSHLVAKVYADVGVEVIDGYEPLKVTPGDLANSIKFEDVTKQILVPAQAVVEEVLDPKFTTLSDFETLRIEGMYAELAPFFEKRGLPVPPSWDLMVLLMARLPDRAAQRALDLEIIGSMQRNKYLDLPTDGIAATIAPLEAYIEQKTYETLSKVAVESELRSLRQNLPALKMMLDNDKDNSKVYGQFHRKTRLNTYQVLRDTKKAHAQNTGRVIALTEELIRALEGRLKALG